MINFDELWDYRDPAGTAEKFRALLPAVRADNTRHAELLTQLARTESLQRNFEAAHALLNEAQALLDERSVVARVRGWLERGRTFNSSGSPVTACDFFRLALNYSIEHKLDFYAVDAAHMLGIAAPADKRLKWNLHALELAEQSAELRARGWLGSLYNNIGWTYHDAADYEKALEIFKKGVVWQRENGKPYNLLIAKWTIGRTLRSLGRHREALENQLVNAAAAAEQGFPDGYTQEEIGECYVAMQQHDKAVAHFASAYQQLANDAWLKANEPDRIKRWVRLGRII